MKIKYLLLFLAPVYFVTFQPALAQTYSQKEAMMISAQVQVSPPGITFRWHYSADADNYYVYRKTKNATSWGTSYASLSKNDTTWSDNNVSEGSAYEYYFQKVKSPYITALSYAYAGIRVPATENRGTVLLLVDNNYKLPLSAEIMRLMLDLVGDGWKVTRLYIDRNSTVPAVKSIITNACRKDTNIKSLFLLGHIPVPYSGLMSIPPDGHDATHGGHTGAWPADVFYADLDGKWTDTGLDTTAARPENRNMPGDGKYDQDIPPSSIELETGRVDLFQMPSFSKNDTFLVKRYLDKEHNFRWGLVNASRRGLIDDNFTSYNLVSQGWRFFSVMFGDTAIHDNVTDGKDYFTTMKTNDYLWSCGSGAGSYTSCSGVGNSAGFVRDSLRTVFTMLTGSFFGDWFYPDNLLRAAIASKSPTIVSFWGGIPQWQLHPMALGECIGYCTRLTQNNSSLYYTGNFNMSARKIHIALMGDPTLRMHVVQPPSELKISGTSKKLLKWNKSKEPVAGYYIYRSNYIWGDFVRLTKTPVTDTFFTDNSPLAGQNVYMVRAVKLELTASGSYFNLSQGLFDTATFSLDAGPREIASVQDYKIYPNPCTGSFVIEPIEPMMESPALSGIEIYDLMGKLVFEDKNPAYSDNWRKTIDLHNSGKGIYWVKISSGGKFFMEKIIVQ